MEEQKIINHLISLGRDIRLSGRMSSASFLEGCEEINRRDHVYWSRVTRRLSDDDLIFLVVGMTVSEKDLKWFGGSVSSVSRLFSLLVKRGVSTRVLDDVAAWVSCNTDNPYNPFGMRVGARTYTELMAYKEARFLKAKEDQERARIAMEEKKNRQYLRSLNSKNRRNAERLEMIEKLGQMSIQEQLVMISKDDRHAVNYYPTKCADSATIDVLESLSDEVRFSLKKKMKGKFKGPWGKFKKRLRIV